MPQVHFEIGPILTDTARTTAASRAVPRGKVHNPLLGPGGPQIAEVNHALFVREVLNCGLRIRDQLDRAA